MASAAEYNADILQTLNGETQEFSGRMTPLVNACFYGRLNESKKLLDEGHNIDDISFNGQTPLIMAAKHGYTEIVNALIQAGQLWIFKMMSVRQR